MLFFTISFITHIIKKVFPSKQCLCLNCTQSIANCNNNNTCYKSTGMSTTASTHMEPDVELSTKQSVSFSNNTDICGEEGIHVVEITHTPPSPQQEDDSHNPED